jgi:hypothetical protein
VKSASISPRSTAGIRFCSSVSKPTLRLCNLDILRASIDPTWFQSVAGSTRVLMVMIMIMICVRYDVCMLSSMVIYRHHCPLPGMSGIEGSDGNVGALTYQST